MHKQYRHQIKIKIFKQLIASISKDTQVSFQSIINCNINAFMLSYYYYLLDTRNMNIHHCFTKAWLCETQNTKKTTFGRLTSRVKLQLTCRKLIERVLERLVTHHLQRFKDMSVMRKKRKLP